VVTKSKDLRTGCSIWEHPRAINVPHRPLTRDIETDVLVVGAGITGALIADALAMSELKVTVVDKRGLAKGSTTASTALVQYEIDTPLIKLVRKIGKTDAVRVWRRSRLALEALESRIVELGVSDVARRGSLFLAGDDLDGNDLAGEQRARRAAGLATLFLDRKALRGRFGIARQAALLSYGDIVLDPRKTTLALLELPWPSMPRSMHQSKSSASTPTEAA
jgi:glycine/D-amino acid oxidase-like deaminating enzyme